ncbi:hypothetical protein PENTCL1PPCAC_11021, partial [Pristionchus entomophagus]
QSNYSMSVYGHTPGETLECLSLAIELRKEEHIDSETREVVLRVGFKLGGGIDQDPARAPYQYPDNGIYVTYIEPDSPADRAGLRRHDKILRVNGNDFTMVTHDRAVKFIKRDNVLNMLVHRWGLPEVR